jgi:ethanolamine transporter
MLPLMYLVAKLLNKPLHSLGTKIGINSVSALALLTTLVSNAPTFGVMEKMDKKGVALNSALAVSASFVFGDHLGFTAGFCAEMVFPMIVGKLVGGVSAVIVAMFMLRKEFK